MSKARELAALGNAFNDGALSNRNLIINGAMQVAQRGTSFTGWTNTSAYALDHWKYTNYQSGAVTVSQDGDAPEGFSKSLKIATTATDSGSSTYSFLQHRFEGQDLSRLAYYTSDPQPVTISFWIKSNMVGTYTLNMLTQNSGRRIASTYTVDSADTWEYKTVTFEGDASSYIVPDNTLGIVAEWWFAAGPDFSTNPLPTTWSGASNASRSTGITVGINTSTSNYVNITGVQLEVGDTATPFEHRSYGQELALCQRYYEKSYNDGVALGTNTQGGMFTSPCNNYSSGLVLYAGLLTYKVPKRSVPTLSFWAHNGSANQWYEGVSGFSEALHAAPSAIGAGTTGFAPYMNSVAATANVMYGQWAADAEL